MSTDQSEIPDQPSQVAPITLSEPAASACHVEDITQPCQNPACGLHTTTHTPAISRAASHTDLRNLAGVSDDVGEATRMVAGNHEPIPESQFIGQPVGNAAHVVEDVSSVAPSIESAPPPPESAPSPTYLPPQTFPSEEATSDELRTSLESTPQDTPGSTLFPQQEQQQINWNFDDPEALQEHVTGGPDPFEQLRQEAPERSSSFPAVPALPTLENQQPDERSILDMMAMEVASGSGERGMFDSPAVEQGSFFGDAPEEEDFFAQAGRQNTESLGVMGSNSRPAEMIRQDTSQQRFDEGMPIMHDEELVVDSKKEMDFFGSEPDSPADEAFTPMDQITTTERPDLMGFQRKNTEQFMSNTTRTHYSNEYSATKQSTPENQEALEVAGENQSSADVPAHNKVEHEEPHVSHVETEKAPESSDFFAAAAAGANEGTDFFAQAAAAEGESTDFFAQAAAAEGESTDFFAKAAAAEGESKDFFAQSSAVEGDDFFSQLGQSKPSQEPTAETAKEDDVDAKWKAVLGDDDEFLDDDEGFLPSDDEGFLPETNSTAPVPTVQTPATGYIPVPQVSQPQNWPGQQPSSSFNPQPNAYQPTQQLRSTQSAYFPRAADSPYAASFAQQSTQPVPEKKPQSFVNKNIGYQSPYDLPMDVLPVIKKRPTNPNHLQGPAMGIPSQPEKKPQSFVDKKEGYQSPYDLPMDVVLPPIKKRTSNLNPLQGQALGVNAPPMRSTSMPMPATAPPPGPPAVSYSVPPRPIQPQANPRYAPAPVPTPMSSLPTPAPKPMGGQYAPDQRRASGPAFAPPPVVPEAQEAMKEQQSNMPAPPPPAVSNRYAAPPPRDLSTPPPPASNNRYATPPVAQSAPIQPPPPVANNRYAAPPVPRSTATPPPPQAVPNRYAAPPVPRTTSTPPPSQKTVVSPPSSVVQRQLSPQKYTPRSGPTSPEAFQPPPRAHTISPGLHYGRQKVGQKSRDPYERPSSALAHSTFPEDYPSAEPQQQVRAPLFDMNREAIQMNFMPPEGSLANDPLERWKGAPVFTWGMGGVVTMFPVRTQRFASDLHSTVIKSTAGVPKFRPLKEVLEFPADLEKFPGPIWTGNKSSNKSKKKEVITYMESRIEAFEKSQLDIYDHTEKRLAEEKCMLWKVVKLMVEHDGVLENIPEIDPAVRKILTPEIAQVDASESSAGFVPMAGMSSMNAANAEPVDGEAMTTFRNKLLSGDREGAVWFAADKRLWAHAMLISGTVGKDLWKRVIEEFVKSEVKTLGNGSESLAVLYATLAGNWEESVDELVPPSARLGMPMLTTTQGQELSLEDRLGKWRESLALILSNRSPGDQASILALGRLLASYGWTAAAHICFIFGRQLPLGGGGALFGGADEPTTDFCLLGANHKSKLELGRDLDSILLSEIYEFAVSLAPHAGTAAPVFPHLQQWKIHHAIILAENGNKTTAQKYCDSIATAGKAWGKPSPYFNPGFYQCLEDLTKRLQEAPRDASSGNASKWIPKLTSDAVSSSVWGAFNKFVSGEEDGQDGSSAAQGDGEGLFGKITPAVSRVQSNADLYGSYGGAAGGSIYNPGFTSGNTSPNATRTTTTTSRYAPSTATARSSMESTRPNIYDPSRRASADSYRGGAMNGSMYEPTGNSYEPSAPGGNPYEPLANPYESPRSMGNSYNPRASLEVTPEVPETSSYAPSPYGSYSNGYQPTGNTGYEPPASTGGYEPPSTGGYEPPSSGGYEPPSSGGYEPPSSGGGYEPPSDGFVPYQPEPDNDDDEEEKPKTKPKKSFLDDEDDDAELLRRAEAVKKAAAEEEKRKAEESKKADESTSARKSGWFGGWFGKKDPAEQTGPIKAKLGEESSFVYDPDLKRWVNKKAGAEPPAPVKAAPPPARRTPAPPISGTSTPPMAPASPAVSLPSPTQPPPSGPATPAPAMTSPPPSGGLAPPPGPPRGLTPSPAPSMASMASRPGTTGGDAMEELLGPPMPRKGTPSGRKPRKGGASRYVEVIPGQK